MKLTIKNLETIKLQTITLATILISPFTVYGGERDKSPERQVMEDVAPSVVKKYDQLNEKYDAASDRVKGIFNGKKGSQNNDQELKHPLTKSEQKALEEQAMKDRYKAEKATSTFAEKNYQQQANHLENQFNHACKQSGSGSSDRAHNDCEAAIRDIGQYRDEYAQANKIRQEKGLAPLPKNDVLSVDPLGDYPNRHMSPDEKDKILARDFGLKRWSEDAEDNAAKPNNLQDSSKTDNALAQITAKGGAYSECADLMQSAYAKRNAGGMPLEWYALNSQCKKVMQELQDSLPKREMEASTKLLFADSIANTENGSKPRSSFADSASSLNRADSAEFDWASFIGLMGQAYAQNRQQHQIQVQQKRAFDQQQQAIRDQESLARYNAQHEAERIRNESQRTQNVQQNQGSYPSQGSSSSGQASNCAQSIRDGFLCGGQ